MHLHTAGSVLLELWVVVGDHNDQLVFGNLAQQSGDTLGGLAVQVPCRFVSNDDIRVFRQRTGDGNTLFLAAGQFRNLCFCKSCKVDFFENVIDTLADFGAFVAIYEQYKFYILINRVAVDQIVVLKNVADVLLAVFFKVRRKIMAGLLTVDEHFAIFVGIQTGNNIQKGRLAAAGLAGDNDKLPFVEFQVDFGNAAGNQAFAIIIF